MGATSWVNVTPGSALNPGTVCQRHAPAIITIRRFMRRMEPPPLLPLPAITTAAAATAKRRVFLRIENQAIEEKAGDLSGGERRIGIVGFERVRRALEQMQV